MNAMQLRINSNLYHSIMYPRIAEYLPQCQIEVVQTLDVDSHRENLNSMFLLQAVLEKVLRERDVLYKAMLDFLSRYEAPACGLENDCLQFAERTDRFDGVCADYLALKFSGAANESVVMHRERHNDPARNILKIMLGNGAAERVLEGLTAAVEAAEKAHAAKAAQTAEAAEDKPATA